MEELNIQQLTAPAPKNTLGIRSLVNVEIAPSKTLLCKAFGCEEQAVAVPLLIFRPQEFPGEAPCDHVELCRMVMKHPVCQLHSETLNFSEVMTETAWRDLQAWLFTNKRPLASRTNWVMQLQPIEILQRLPQ